MKATIPEQNQPAVAGPADQQVMPTVWVRRNSGFNSGVAHYGPDCPPGWGPEAEPLYTRAALDAAVAQELCAKR